MAMTAFVSISMVIQMKLIKVDSIWKSLMNKEFQQYAQKMDKIFFISKLSKIQMKSIKMRNSFERMNNKEFWRIEDYQRRFTLKFEIFDKLRIIRFYFKSEITIWDATLKPWINLSHITSKNISPRLEKVHYPIQFRLSPTKDQWMENQLPQNDRI
jgi:hypothetical protein